MYKILTAIAVVALAALGTSIIATVLLHSSISKQSKQISGLESTEHSDQRKIAALEGEVGAGSKNKKLTAALRHCQRQRPLLAPQSLALATLTIRRDPRTDWIALTDVQMTSDVTASRHCG